ncbi:hypothetical protein R3P38DRAFT_3294607 [Favolaschia claudopus]|uniref:Uncharacterized protein n=1 Tax=Favolaschia claudopus TaxID=2862362 RepID=A0AAV9ZE89_9AGAR
MSDHPIALARANDVHSSPVFSGFSFDLKRRAPRYGGQAVTGLLEDEVCHRRPSGARYSLRSPSRFDGVGGGRWRTSSRAEFETKEAEDRMGMGQMGAYVPNTVAPVLVDTVLLSTSAASSISDGTSRSPVTPPPRSHTWVSARPPRALQVSLPQLYDSSICHTHAVHSVRSDTLPDRYPTAALPYGREHPVPTYIHYLLETDALHDAASSFVRRGSMVRGPQHDYSWARLPWGGGFLLLRYCPSSLEGEGIHEACSHASSTPQVHEAIPMALQAQALASGAPSPPSSFPPCTNPVCMVYA